MTLTATDTQEIERVKLATMSVDLRIPFPVFGLTIGDLAAFPIDSRTLAVEYSYLDPTAGPFIDIEILDDGVRRPKMLSSVPTNAYSTNIQWRPDGAKLYIRDPTTLSVSAVESDGLAAASKILALAYGDGFFGFAFQELNGLLYSDGGGVLDPSTKRAFAAYEDPAATAILYTLQSFDLSRFKPV